MSSDCPSGQDCYSGVCLREAPPGTLPYPSGDPDPEHVQCLEGAGLCKLATLVDKFNDGVIGPEWTVFNGEIEEQSGQLRLSMSSAPVSRVIGTSATYDFTETECRIQILEYPSAGKVAFFVSPPGQTAIATVTVEGATVTLATPAGGVQTIVNLPTPINVRVREASGVLHLEHSMDAIDWNPLLSASTPPGADEVNLFIGVSNTGGSPTPERLRLDSVGPQ